MYRIVPIEIASANFTYIVKIVLATLPIYWYVSNVGKFCLHA